MPFHVIALLALLSVLIIYAFAIEPRRLELTQYDFIVPNLPLAFDGFQFLHVADPHSHKLGPRERLLLRLIDSRPGLPILLTGDVALKDVRVRAPYELLRMMRSMHEVWMVPGNHDKPRQGRGDFSPMQQEAEALGARVLFNQSQALERDHQQLWLTGVDDPDKGLPDLDLALRDVPGDACIVLLAHSPDIWLRAQDRVDLVLCGHTHGGQIRVPLIGAVVTRAHHTPRPWCMGLNRISPRTQMFVSRGIGLSTLLPARLLCRPEVSVITLKRGSSQ